MFKIQKEFKRAIALFFAIWFTFCSLVVGSIEAEAHDAYFFGIAFDTDSCRYIGTVSFQSNSLIGDNHAESEITCDFWKIYDSNNAEAVVPIIDYANPPDDMEAQYPQFEQNSSFHNDKELLFTFPGFHTKGISTYRLDAIGTDELLAERINNSVLGGLNSAIDFISNQAGTSRTNSKEIRNLAALLANAVKSNSGNSSGSFTWQTNRGAIPVQVSYNNSSLPASATIEEDDIPKGFEPQDYCEITVNGKSACFIYQAWKGYKYPTYTPNGNNRVSEDVDPYARDVTGNNWYKDVGKNGVMKLGWDAIVLQAHYNKDVRGVEFSNLGEILPSSALTDGIAKLCDFVITGIRSFLGLYALDELMLNKGSRGDSYSMGLFPKGWVGPIYLLYTICLMLTWAVMGFAVIKIFMKRSLATMNIGEKMNIMNELKNLAVCCFMLGAFPLIFNMLARINYSLVQLFGSSTQFPGLIKSFYTLSQANFGSIIACFMGLALQIYFNFFYVLRAITIAILYGIAPLAIYTIVLGGKNAKVFGAWTKELFSNIFVQTIHALMIAFFTSVSALSGLKTFESLVVLYSFIPLTKFVKQNVFQASDGIGGMAANLTDMTQSGARGMAERASGGGGKEKSSGGSSSGGSAGSGGGPSTGILADRMAQTKDPGRRAVTNSFSDNADKNVSGKTEQKFANFVDRDHGKNVAAKAVSWTANKGRNAVDSVRGYHDEKIDGLSLNPEDKAFGKVGEKQRDLGNVNNRGRIAASGGFSVAKGILGAAGNVALGAAQMGMALGTSSYGGSGADRLMKEGTSRVGGSVGSLKKGINEARGNGDRKVLQHMKNHGVESMREDSKFITKDYAMDYRDHNFQGEAPKNMTPAEYNTLLNLYRANDPTYNGFSKQERAFYQTQGAKMGIHVGVRGGSGYGKYEGKVQVKIDKAAYAQNRGSDPVTYGNVMSEYHEPVKPASGEKGEQIDGNQAGQQSGSSGGSGSGGSGNEGGSRPAPQGQGPSNGGGSGSGGSGSSGN